MDKITSKEEWEKLARYVAVPTAMTNLRKTLGTANVSYAPWWVHRELWRIERGVYESTDLTVWINAAEGYQRLVHCSFSNPEHIAFTPSKEYGMADRQLHMSVGVYLAKYHPTLADHEIAQLVAQYKSERSNEILFSESFEEFVELYKEGPDSCMSKDYSISYLQAYDCPNIKLAYLRNAQGNCSARAIIRTDRNTYIRAYGDPALQKRLHRLGYTPGTWEGQVFKKVVNTTARHDQSGTAYYMPYLDAKGTVGNVEDCSLALLDGNLTCVSRELKKKLDAIGYKTKLGATTYGFVVLEDLDTTSHYTTDIFTGELLNPLTMETPLSLVVIPTNTHEDPMRTWCSNNVRIGHTQVVPEEFIEVAVATSRGSLTAWAPGSVPHRPAIRRPVVIQDTSDEEMTATTSNYEVLLDPLYYPRTTYKEVRRSASGDWNLTNALWKGLCREAWVKKECSVATHDGRFIRIEDAVQYVDISDAANSYKSVSPHPITGKPGQYYSKRAYHKSEDHPAKLEEGLPPRKRKYIEKDNVYYLKSQMVRTALSNRLVHPAMNNVVMLWDGQVEFTRNAKCVAVPHSVNSEACILRSDARDVTKWLDTEYLPMLHTATVDTILQVMSGSGRLHSLSTCAHKGVEKVRWALEKILRSPSTRIYYTKTFPLIVKHVDIALAQMEAAEAPHYLVPEVEDLVDAASSAEALGYASPVTLDYNDWYGQLEDARRRDERSALIAASRRMTALVAAEPQPVAEIGSVTNPVGA